MKFTRIAISLVTIEIRFDMPVSFFEKVLSWVGVSVDESSPATVQGQIPLWRVLIRIQKDHNGDWVIRFCPHNFYKTLLPDHEPQKAWTKSICE